MKKIIFPILVLNSLVGYSQIDLYKGNPKSNSKGVDVYLTTNGDQYILGYTLGTLSEINGETLLEGYSKPANTTVVTGNSKTIDVNFSCNSYEYAAGKYKIAYQDAKNKKQYLDVVITKDNFEYNELYQTQIQIPKTSKYYLVINYDETNAIELTYEIPNNAIEINTNIINGSSPEKNNKLSVEISNDKSIIKISENGYDEIVFSKNFNNTEFLNELVLDYSKSESVKSTYKYSNENYDGSNDYAVSPNIKIQSYKTIDEGITNLKKLKDKFLIVIVENSQESQSINYDLIVQQYANSLQDQSYYYEESQKERGLATLDKFVFVKATNKDKKWLEKKGFNLQTPKVLFVDKSGTVLKYNSNSGISEYLITNSLAYSFEGYKQILGLENVNALHKLMQNKKAKTSDFIKHLKMINTNSISYQSNFVIPPPPAKSVGNVNEDSEAVVDDNAVVDSLDYYYNEPDFEYNFPDFSQDKLNTIYNNLLDESAKNFNPEIISIIENELKNSGFSAVLFNKFSTKAFTDTDFKAINLLIDNSDKIEVYKKDFFEKLSEKPYDPLDLDYVYVDNFDATFDSVILEAINSQLYNLAEENYLNLKNEKAILNIIKRLFEKAPDKITYLTRYFDVLTKNQAKVDFVNPDFSELCSLFDTYYNNQFNTNGSIIEVLDSKYSTLTATDKNFFFDWINYKNTHANLANNLAWAVAEKRDTANYNKAIKWTNFAVALDKNSEYYLDTLGHLYYLSGNKAKGIEIQTKAIEATKLKNNTSSEEQAISVLQKMKNGTL